MANPTRGRLAPLLLLAPLLGGCSYLSATYALQDAVGARPSDADRRWETCEKARANMIAARDPVEARRWELLREDLSCPTQREILER
ncbi:hypothetical protein ROR02_31270 [Pararhodospirillum oryzae]|uniref:Lipoprotein n=1 Tax=Pararhodospirillum oryzae TaxID=478448 RepID=A0A512HC20_9PROT|nr:hypothetical protein ROR02_31270 [Pararhodospirillum oryzae]